MRPPARCTSWLNRVSEPPCSPRSRSNWTPRRRTSDTSMSMLPLAATLNGRPRLRLAALEELAGHDPRARRGQVSRPDTAGNDRGSVVLRPCPHHRDEPCGRGLLVVVDELQQVAVGALVQGAVPAGGDARCRLQHVSDVGVGRAHLPSAALGVVVHDEHARRPPGPGAELLDLRQDLGEERREQRRSTVGQDPDLDAEGSPVEPTRCGRRRGWEVTTVTGGTR